MDSVIIELVSNASFNCYPKNSLSSLTIFLRDQIHLKAEWEVANSDISYSSLHQNVTEGNRNERLREKKIEPMHIEPGLYPGNNDILVAMNDKNRKRIDAQKMNMKDFLYQ